MNPITPSRTRKDLEERYEWFFRGEYQGVVRTVFLIVGDREVARELTQEAFVRLYRHWKKVSRYDRPEAWVRQVAVRLGIQHVRRRALQNRLSPAETTQEAIDPGIWDVRKAVRSLPAAQRAAVALYYFEDRPSSEVAAILGCTEATVRVHLHKARRKLAGVLRESRTNAG